MTEKSKILSGKLYLASDEELVIDADVLNNSVVIGSLPGNCIAAGNPCVVKRLITEQDKDRWKALAE